MNRIDYTQLSQATKNYVNQLAIRAIDSFRRRAPQDYQLLKQKWRGNDSLVSVFSKDALCGLTFNELHILDERLNCWYIGEVIENQIRLTIINRFTEYEESWEFFIKYYAKKTAIALTELGAGYCATWFIQSIFWEIC